jgi:Flp pilus assembly protein TadD
MMTRALAEWQDPMRLNGVAWECAIRDLYLNDAVALARRAVQLDSTNVDILDTLAEALYRSGDADSAIVVAERAVALDPLSKYLQDQLERFHKPREATRTSR